jgi:hypothetical protein
LGGSQTRQVYCDEISLLGKTLQHIRLKYAPWHFVWSCTI